MENINNIKIGNSAINSIFINSIECKDAYLGNTHIYHKELQDKGVGIMLIDGSIIDYNKININQSYTREDIIGITIQNDNISIIISPDIPPKAYFCSAKVSCDSAIVEIGINGAGNKYIGEEATTTLRACLTADSTWAVNKAYNVILNGKHCYLPYQGELRIIHDNRTYINELLEKCGCSALPGGDYWSSAILQKTENGYLDIVAGINFTSNEIWGLNVQGLYNVLPIAKLN